MYVFRVNSPFKNEKAKNIVKFDSFHRALMPVTFFMQLFGFLSFSGVFASNISEISHKFFSRRFCYSFFTLISILVESFCALLSMQSIKISNIDTLFYRITSSYAAYRFFVFSLYWPEFIKYWTSQEEIFLGSLYRVAGKSLRFKILLVTCLIFIPAYIEHGELQENSSICSA